jgi:hypothetical protein
MRRSILYLMGVITLVMVLGLTHVAMAYVSWSPTITPTYATSIVSSLQASYTWGTLSALSATSSNPLYVYIPGNIYLGSYANGYYYAAVNFTVTVYNPGSSSAITTIYVVCPSPLGSAIASVTVGAMFTATVTLTLTANINGPVTQPGQFLQCQVYLSSLAISAISIQLPVEVTNYGIDYYANAYHPAFTVQFNAPYFVFSGSTYEPSLSIVPFAGLTMGSTLFLVQTGVSGSDTSTFSLPTPSSAGQSYSLEFIITSLPYQSRTGSGNTYYSIVPIVWSFSQTVPTYNPSDAFYLGVDMGMFINQNSGATMTTIYASPNGITITPMGVIYAVYTNSSRWFTYTVWVLPNRGTWQKYTGIAFPAAPGGSNEFYALVFMRNATIYGSNLPVPVLFMFNVINPGYTMNTALITQVNGSSTTPLPSGLGLSAVFGVYGNYTIANITMSTPIINITSDLLLVGAYGYAPSGWTRSNEYVGPTYNTYFQRYWYAWAYSSTENAFASWGIYFNVIALSPYIYQFTVTELNGYSFANHYVVPDLNLTVTSSGSAPTWSLGVSLQNLVIPMGANHGVTIVMPYDFGEYISTPSITSNNLIKPISAYGFREYVSNHMLQYFINSTVDGLYLIAYPWGSINATVINIYPNGTYTVVGYQLVPVLSPTRGINETVASYFVTSTGTYVNDLIFTLDQTPQVAALFNGQFVPGVQVFTTGYSASISKAPKVTTSSSGYVYMGYAIPQDVAYAFGSTNEVYTTIYVTKYLIGTLYASYNSVAGPEQYSYSLPSLDDPVVGLELLEQPQNVISVSSVSVSPTNITASPGETVNITVTVTLSQAPQVAQSYQGTVTLNGTQVATFTISVPAGRTSASTTVTFNAPSTVGKYNGVVSVDGKSAQFTLTVSGIAISPPSMTGLLVFIIIIIIIAVAGYLIHRRRRGEVVIRL